MFSLESVENWLDIYCPKLGRWSSVHDSETWIINWTGLVGLRTLHLDLEVQEGHVQLWSWSLVRPRPLPGQTEAVSSFSVDGRVKHWDTSKLFLQKSCKRVRVSELLQPAWPQKSRGQTLLLHLLCGFLELQWAGPQSPAAVLLRGRQGTVGIKAFIEVCAIFLPHWDRADLAKCKEAVEGFDTWIWSGEEVFSNHRQNLSSWF